MSDETFRARMLRPRIVISGLGIVLAAVAALTVYASSQTPAQATATAGRAIPKAAIAPLRGAALKFAKLNGDSAPRSVKAVATTHAIALLAATPGDKIKQNSRQAVYLVIMRGHFTYNGPGPAVPGGAAGLSGSYLAVVFNSKTFTLEDFGMRNKRPPVALSSYGPVATLR